MLAGEFEDFIRAGALDLEGEHIGGAEFLLEGFKALPTGLEISGDGDTDAEGSGSYPTNCGSGSATCTRMTRLPKAPAR